MAKRIKEEIAFTTRIRIEYEDRPGARENIVSALKDGPLEINGWHADFGGYSSKILGKTAEERNR